MKQHHSPSNKKDRVQFASYVSRKIEHQIVKITDIENLLPPYSPDLNPCNFFFWWYLKSVVCKDPVLKALDDLRTVLEDKSGGLSQLLYKKSTTTSS